MNNGHTPGTPRTARRALRLPLHIHIATLFFLLLSLIHISEPTRPY